MSIPTSGPAALLVVVTLALTSCGGDDAAEQDQAGGPAAAQTVTQTATATATAPQQEASRTSTQPATAEKTQEQTRTQTSAATEEPAAATQQPAGPCQPVEVGARAGDVDVTYARITQARKVDCATATYIAAQWGGQQLGVDKALLPLDWECTKGNVCTKGSSRVTFELVRPG